MVGSLRKTDAGPFQFDAVVGLDVAVSDGHYACAVTLEVADGGVGWERWGRSAGGSCLWDG